MGISIQISVYPLRQQHLSPAIRAVSKALKVAGRRWRGLRWASGLFPGPFWNTRARLPLGDVIGLAVALAP